MFDSKPHRLSIFIYRFSMKLFYVCIQVSKFKILFMKISTKQILKVMNVLSWIIFVCLCIRTGAILFSCFVSLFLNPVAAKDLYIGLNLYDLKHLGMGHYLI